MTIAKSLVVLGIMAVLICTVSAIDFTNWKEITVDESLVNKSSTTVFTVMAPPGYTNLTIDSPVGPMTTFVNETDPNATLAIYVIDNPIKQQLSEKNSNEYLDNFMLGANITPIPDTEPLALDNGVVDYGTSGENIAGVYVLSTDAKVMIVLGYYTTQDAAKAGIENLAMVAGTIKVAEVV
jgi:hypothetical protein